MPAPDRSPRWHSGRAAGRRRHRLGSKRTRAPLRAVLDGVLHEVLEHLHDLVAVAADDGGRGKRRRRACRRIRGQAARACRGHDPARRSGRRGRSAADARRISTRQSDSSSSIRRVMRSACSAMMARKRSRAAGSSLAAACSVSTKPRSEASGVRSSWLALAMKSARIWLMRSISVRSRKSTMMSLLGSVPQVSGATVAATRRPTGTRSA